MNTVILSAKLEITPLKFDTDIWLNWSTGYRITCTDYTQEELDLFWKIVNYAHVNTHTKNSVIVFALEEVLNIVKEFHANTPNLHTILNTPNHPVFNKDFRKELRG